MLYDLRNELKDIEYELGHETKKSERQIHNIPNSKNECLIQTYKQMKLLSLFKCARIINRRKEKIPKKPLPLYCKDESLTQAYRQIHKLKLLILVL